MTAKRAKQGEEVQTPTPLIQCACLVVHGFKAQATAPRLSLRGSWVGSYQNHQPAF
jgi:hypothetical protein